MREKQKRKCIWRRYFPTQWNILFNPHYCLLLKVFLSDRKLMGKCFWQPDSNTEYSAHLSLPSEGQSVFNRCLKAKSHVAVSGVKELLCSCSTSVLSLSDQLNLDKLTFSVTRQTYRFKNGIESQLVFFTHSFDTFLTLWSMNTAESSNSCEKRDENVLLKTP